MASINPYQFEPKLRNVFRPTNVLGGGSHTPDPDDSQIQATLRPAHWRNQL